MTTVDLYTDKNPLTSNEIWLIKCSDNHAPSSKNHGYQIRKKTPNWKIDAPVFKLGEAVWYIYPRCSEMRELWLKSETLMKIIGFTSIDELNTMNLNEITPYQKLFDEYGEPGYSLIPYSPWVSLMY